METDSSETLIGWKSRKTTYVPLRDRMEGERYGLRPVTEMYQYLKSLPRPFFKPTLGVIRGGQRNFFSESAIRYSVFSHYRYQPDSGLKR